MIKVLSRLLLGILILVILVIAYLAVFGIKTEKFNNKIISEVQRINKKIDLNLKDVKILLNIRNLSVNVKTLDPEISVNNKQLKLEYIKTNIPLKSFINKDFSFDDLNLSTKKNKLSDLIYLVRSFKNSTELFILDSIIKDGFLVGDINLNFDDKGKIKNDYEIKGFVKEVNIKILKKYKIDNLNFSFNIKTNEYIIKDVGANFNKLSLSLPLIDIREENNSFSIKGNLVSENNNIDLKILSNLLNIDLKKIGIKKIELGSSNKFYFNLGKKFNISNFNLNSQINLDNLIYENNVLGIEKYLPSFDKLVEFKNHKIFIDYRKNNLKIDGNGNISSKDKTDNLKYKIIKKDDNYRFNARINLNNNSLLIDSLDFEKKEYQESSIKFNGTYTKKKEIKFNSISFNEKKNNFLIKDLTLDNEFRILNIKLIKSEYVNKNNIKNEINLKKNDNKYLLYGSSFDISKLINNILDESDEKTSPSLFKNLSSKLDIKIEKTYLDKKIFTNNLKGTIDYKNNNIFRLRLDSLFPNNKKLSLTIKTNDNNEKITTLFAGHPKPLVKQYKFIKGFEEGVMDFYSIKKDGISNSVLKIDNFKVQEVPALAKLLTLASLQGIADLLTGEGIRFTDFEMKFSNKKNVITIEELYAIGPAISILMDGYIQNNELISLRGTLVPATTINRTISSIPLIGNILVGKKTGEGVFGVSFKIKGPPKDLKTSVNPVKTLTPRFITRTLEKIKKN